MQPECMFYTLFWDLFFSADGEPVLIFGISTTLCAHTDKPDFHNAYAQNGRLHLKTDFRISRLKRRNGFTRWGTHAKEQ